MATHLVLIENLGTSGNIEMHHYIGKAFQCSIGTNPKEYDTKQSLLDVIENFRVNGEKILA